MKRGDLALAPDSHVLPEAWRETLLAAHGERIDMGYETHFYMAQRQS